MLHSPARRRGVLEEVQNDARAAHRLARLLRLRRARLAAQIALAHCLLVAPPSDRAVEVLQAVVALCSLALLARASPESAPQVAFGAGGAFLALLVCLNDGAAGLGPFADTAQGARLWRVEASASC